MFDSLNIDEILCGGSIQAFIFYNINSGSFIINIEISEKN